jgi:hypothetical protein
MFDRHEYADEDAIEGYPDKLGPPFISEFMNWELILTHADPGVFTIMSMGPRSGPTSEPRCCSVETSETHTRVPDLFGVPAIRDAGHFRIITS